MRHYDAHVTVHPEDEQRLRKLMHGHRKPIKVLSFHNLVGEAGVLPDVMTAEKFQEDNDKDALTRLTRFANKLQDDGVRVIRYKLETSPFGRTGDCAPGQYYETHLRILCPFDRMPRGLLYSVDRWKLHTLATLRTRADYADHLRQLSLKSAELCLGHVQIAGDVETEFAVFDSNPAHDQQWEDASV